MQNSPLLQLLVLAGIAVFLILRLKSVLGTREGYESSDTAPPKVENSRRHDFEVIEGGPDHDVTDHVEEGSPEADALYTMKAIEPSFSVTEFVGGARGAYEMIVMGFERGNLDDIKSFLAEDIYETFKEVVDARTEQGLTIEAEFVGVREVKVVDATFDEDTQEAEIAIRFMGELTSTVRNADGEIIEGSPTEIKRQKDTWAFARRMGTDDPNWLLVSTDA